MACAHLVGHSYCDCEEICPIILYTAMSASPKSPVDPKRQPLSGDASTWFLDTNTFVPSATITLTSTSQLSAEGIDLVLSTATTIRSILSGHADDKEKAALGQCLNHKILSVVSYTPNPKSDASHIQAFTALGGGTLHVDASKKGKANMTSAKKGETLADTLSCMECYGDVAVLRHWNTDAVDDAIRRSSKGLLLSGGAGDDVTGALGDLLTILEGCKIDKARDGSSVSKPLVLSFVGNFRDGVSPALELITLLGKHMASLGRAVVIRCNSNGQALLQDAESFLKRSRITVEEAAVSNIAKDTDVLYLCDDTKAVPGVSPGAIVLNGDGGKNDSKQAEDRMFVRMAVYKLMLSDNTRKSDSG